MTAEIVIVDDVKEWRVRLRSFLEVIPSFRGVAEAVDGLEAVEKAAKPPNRDSRHRNAAPNGIEAARRIRVASPQSGILFLTQEHDSEIKAAALNTGAAAYLNTRLRTSAHH